MLIAVNGVCCRPILTRKTKYDMLENYSRRDDQLYFCIDVISTKKSVNPILQATATLRKSIGKMMETADYFNMIWTQDDLDSKASWGSHEPASCAWKQVDIQGTNKSNARMSPPCTICRPAT